MSSFPFKTFLAALLAYSCFVPVAQAADITWDGGAGTTNWSDSNNWVGDLVPTSDDTARVNTNGVTVNNEHVLANYIYIGSSGTGTILIENGGGITSQQGTLGRYGSSSGTTTVTGPGSSWVNSGNFYVGYQGSGNLIISSQANVSVTGNLYVCFATGCTGNITIEGGGTLVNKTGMIGFTSSSAVVTVTGTGSTWINSALGIGQNGSGAIHVTNGGIVSASLDLNIGNVNSAVGTATVEGEGSQLISYAALDVGRHGSGILTISDSGNVSATGVLTIARNSDSTGTLNIGAASGSAAVVPGTVTASSIAFGSGTGKIVFNHTSSDYTFANNISGSGTIESLAGTTYLTGDLSGFTGTYDLEGGTLSVVTSGVQTLSSSLSGSGTMAFTSGSTYLTGNSSSFTGTSDVSGTGMLSVNGTLGGTVDVASGGRLQGSGTVGAVDAASGGTVAPGNSIGTLNVAGNVSFASGSTYEVEANATSSDKIIATGAATLTGGTVSLIPYQGALLRAGTTYTILTAAGGVSGAFDSVTLALDSLFLTPRLSYDSNDVYASIVQSRSFASVAASGNQANAAAAIESLGAGSTLYDAVALQSDVATTQQAYQSLTGEIHANIKASILEDQAGGASRLADRLADTQGGIADNSRVEAKPAAAPSARTRTLYGDKVAQTSAQSMAQTDVTLWGQGFGDWGRRDATANAAAFKHQTQGLMTGVDWMLSAKWRAGLAFGYGHADYNQDDHTGANGKGDHYSVSAYAGRSWDKLSLRTGLTYGYHELNTTRSISFPYERDTLKADHDAHSVSAFGEVGYALGTTETKAEPFANLTYGYVNESSFTEKGGAAALHVAGSAATLGTTTMGVRMRQLLPFADGSANKASLKASLGWLHALGDTSVEEKQTFVGSRSGFTTQSAPLARDAAVVGTGIDYLIGQSAALGIAYTGQLANKADTQSVHGTLTYRF